jgi:hypothetical protein
MGYEPMLTTYLAALSTPITVIVKGDGPSWTTYLSALSTPVLAVIAASIAYQQWRTAQNKLKLDLFEKRFAVYQAVVALVYLVLHDKENRNESRVEELSEKAAPAKFLFNREVARFVEEIRKKARSVVLLDTDLAKTFSPLVAWAAKDHLAREEEWLDAQMQVLDAMFKPFLRLSH